MNSDISPIDYPTIDDAVRAFFLLHTAGSPPIHIALVRDVERRLRNCIESEARPYLDDEDWAWVQEHQAVRPGVVARIMSAYEIFPFLSHFAEPRWQSNDVRLRALQLTLTESLAKMIAANGLAEMEEVSTALRTIHSAASRATLEWRRQRALRVTNAAGKSSRSDAPKGALQGPAG